MKRFGYQLQLTAPIVGPSFDQIEQFFVFLDKDIRYTVESPLKAIDITFKSMHALDAQYPPEANHMQQLLQRAIYELPHNEQYEAYFGDLEKLLNEFSTYEARLKSSYQSIKIGTGSVTFFSKGNRNITQWPSVSNAVKNFPVFAVFSLIY